jgi:hypothetical protein
MGVSCWAQRKGHEVCMRILYLCRAIQYRESESRYGLDEYAMTCTAGSRSIFIKHCTSSSIVTKHSIFCPYPSARPCCPPVWDDVCFTPMSKLLHDARVRQEIDSVRMVAWIPSFGLTRTLSCWSAYKCPPAKSFLLSAYQQSNHASCPSSVGDVPRVDLVSITYMIMPTVKIVVKPLSV